MKWLILALVLTSCTRLDRDGLTLHQTDNVKIYVKPNVWGATINLKWRF